MQEIDRKEAAGFFFAGAIVGGAIALLCAQKSGEQTRKDIRAFAQKTVEGLDDLQTDISSQVKDWVHDLTDIVTAGVDRGTKLGAEGYEQMLQGFDAAKKCVEDGRNQLDHLIKRT